MAWSYLADSILWWCQWKEMWNQIVPLNYLLSVLIFISLVSILSLSCLRVALKCCCGGVPTSLHKLSLLQDLSLVGAGQCVLLAGSTASGPSCTWFKWKQERTVELFQHLPFVLGPSCLFRDFQSCTVCLFLIEVCVHVFTVSRSLDLLNSFLC